MSVVGLCQAPPTVGGGGGPGGGSGFHVRRLVFLGV